MKKNQNAKKEITRSEYIKIRVSKEEKELFYKYAEDMGINPTRLARNILMNDAESIAGKIIYKPTLAAYRKYLEVTNQKEAIERMKEE